MQQDFLRHKPSANDLARLEGMWRQHPRYRGCIGNWTMSEGGGLVARNIAWPGTGDGTLTNGPGVVMGRLGPALEFDGVDDYVDMGDPSSGILDFGASQNFAIAVWVQSSQPGTSGQFPNVIEKNGGASDTGYRIILHSEDTFPKWYGSIAVSGTWYNVEGRTDVADGNWHHLVLIRNGSTLYSYEDGILADTASASNASIANAVTLRLGRSHYGSPWDYWYDGLIDDVRIYNRALTNGEIASLYAQPYAEFTWAMGFVSRRWFLPPGDIVASLSTAIETSLAQALTRTKLRALGLNQEVNATQSAVAAKFSALSAATEMSLSQALTRVKQMAVGLASDVNTVRPLSPAGEVVVPMDLAAETNLVQPVTSRKAKGAVQAAETGLAQSFSSRKIVSAFQGIETDLAQGLGVAKMVAIAAAVESELSQDFASRKIMALAQATEADLSQSLSSAKVASMGVSTETSEATELLWAPKHRRVGKASEFEQAHAVSGLVGGQPLDVKRLLQIMLREMLKITKG